MKKNPYLLLWLLLTTLSLASCKKDEPSLQVTPTTSIVFDDSVDKITADYKIGSTLTLKVAAPNATSISIITTYTTGTVRTVNLGSFPVAGGVANVAIPANSLRAAADGTPVGAPSGATAAVRTANTYTFTVDATDGMSTSRRFYSAVLVQ